MATPPKGRRPGAAPRPAPAPAPKPKGDRPYAVARLGAYKVSCWKNEGDHGHFYSCVLKRVYKVGEEWKETDKLNHSDLLMIAQLITSAYSNLMMDDGKLRYETLEPPAADEAPIGADGDPYGEGDAGVDY